MADLSLLLIRQKESRHGGGDGPPAAGLDTSGAEPLCSTLITLALTIIAVGGTPVISHRKLSTRRCCGLDGHLAQNGRQTSRSGRARACLPRGIDPALKPALGSAMPSFGPVRLDCSGQPKPAGPGPVAVWGHLSVRWHGSGFFIRGHQPTAPSCKRTAFCKLTVVPWVASPERGSNAPDWKVVAGSHAHL
jgi:hypothetical protein